MRARFIPISHRARARWLIAFGVLAVILLVALPVTGGPVSLSRTVVATDEPSMPRQDELVLWSDDFNRRPIVPMTDWGVRPERFGRYVTRDARALQFDPTGGVQESGAVRIPWSATLPGARCEDDSRILEASFPPTRELVIQFSVRYSPGFVFDWSGSGPCSGNAKKLFLLWAAEGSRFVFIAENGALGVGSDHDHPLFAQNRGVTMRLAEFGDGQWHRVTLQVRQSSSPKQADGAITGWIDGVRRWEYRDLVTHNEGGYYLFKMPATFNSGSPRAQTEWVDDLRIWRVQ